MRGQRIINEFHQGQCIDAWTLFGAHPACEKGEEGVRFTVYAPNARHISVIGSFNGWDGHRNPMERTGFSGVWSVFVPGAKHLDSYQYRIGYGFDRTCDKSDPYAFFSELRPKRASLVYDLSELSWSDGEWMRNRTVGMNRPISVYEVYAGGWKRNKDGPMRYAELQEQLIPYVKEQGFTHIELMPINEHPFDGSWGYQASGYYSCTSRYGTPKEFASFVNACHNAGIGVILDMVPVHFVRDSFGLVRFDGQPLYEYARSEEAESQWGTLNFNLAKDEVRSFLISAAIFWCEIYHIDGIRTDAVSNIIYRGGDPARGTNEKAIHFLRRMNYFIKKEYPDVMLAAEDSSAFVKVTAPTAEGGLGFDYKWDLGWMNDTLNYYAVDPLYRFYEHGKLTFSMAYFYSEKFVLPLSHDENVHGKKTIIGRMWGNEEQQFAQARNLYAYMYAHPGKKLNFMGNEIASFREFDEEKELDWFLLEDPRHLSFLRFFKELNQLYLTHGALFEKDYDFSGFRWADSGNARQSVFSFLREGEKEILLCVMNLTDAGYENFSVPVSEAGMWKEILNTDEKRYGGSGFINPVPQRAAGRKGPGSLAFCISIRLAPFAAVWFITRKKRKRTRKTLK